MKRAGVYSVFVCLVLLLSACGGEQTPAEAAEETTPAPAVSAALDEELQRRYGQRVSFGIGVNWGPAVVGSIGAPKRLDDTAIGDTVNTAARLEANAPGGTILISRAVADQLGARAEVTSLGGSVPLKGKAQGFEVLTLDRLDGTLPRKTGLQKEAGSGMIRS